MRRLSALLLALTFASPAWAANCLDAARALNARLAEPVNPAELADALTVLNATGRLPARFVTKRDAREAGWQPGRSLWASPALKGKALGGDRFGNRERRLPRAEWHEADLDYRGGKRNAKRLLFSTAGQRYVTVDHYQTFLEVPPCR